MWFFCCTTFDYCWSSQKEFSSSLLWRLSSFSPLLRSSPSILSHPTRSVSLQTFTPLILSLNIFTTAKQEMALLNRKREGDGGGDEVFINNDDNVCQWLSPILASVSSVFPPACSGEETKTIPSWDSPEKRGLFSHHSGALDKIHNEPTDRNDYVGDHSNAWRNLTWVPHSAGQRFPP